MKMFKKCLALMLALMLVLCLCACNQSGEGNEGGNSQPSSSAPTTPTQGNSEPTIPDNKVQYKVKVMDTEGNPLVGVLMQLCTEETCLAPVKTDETGVATFTPADEAEYHAKISKIPTGYEADAEDFYFADGEKELTIVLKTVADSET